MENNRTKREDHHILHDRISWEARGESKLLRRDRSLIVPLETETHRELHKQTPVVPLLGYFALYRVARDYERGSSYLESIENLQRAIEAAASHPKAHDIERQLGGLTVHTLELQKEFINHDHPNGTYL